MCGTNATPYERAEAALSRLLEKETGVKIDPHLLSLFIRVRWERIKPLAHAIHEQGAAE